MKVNVFLILILCIPIGVLGQEAQIPGEYGKFVETKDGSIVKWTVSLSPDGTFLYNFYRKLNCQTCEEENFWGKGNWTAEGKVITIRSDEERDLDSKFTMDFSHTKARLQSKPARSLSNEDIPVELIFYDSPLSVIEGLKLQKKTP
ncbi:hypothetical protein [Sediminicola sp. 1XM1-17]|uniref:hypothetical protein n=1 Tax=Sediminicola sp. 1XM1-17 TaxID=3127702 RepID=UPI003076C131